MQRNVRRAGGKWNPQRRLWEMRYDQAVAQGLEDRLKNHKFLLVETWAVR
jgi:hypothetical protein